MLKFRLSIESATFFSEKEITKEKISYVYYNHRCAHEENSGI